MRRGPGLVRPALRSIALLIAFLGLAPALWAQDAVLRSAVDTTVIHVGDRVRLRVVVDHGVDQEVVWPDSISVAPFEVVEVRVGESDPIESGLRSRAEYLLTSFELGELDIPSFDVTVTSESGASTSLETDPFRLGVLSVGIDESGELRDIKGPLSLPREWWLIGVLLLATVLLLLALRYFLRRRKKKPEVEAAPPPPPLRPFHEIALERLDALAASTLLQEGEVKAFHIRLSDVLREYIEGQLSVPAMEMATGEVVHGLHRAALGVPLCEAFGDFLTRCDLVKFAKLRPTDQTSQELLEVGRSLVNQTSGWASDEDEPEAREGMDGQEGMDSEEGIHGQEGMDSEEGVHGQQGMDSEEGIHGQEGMDGETADGAGPQPAAEDHA